MRGQHCISPYRSFFLVWSPIVHFLPVLAGSDLSGLNCMRLLYGAEIDPKIAVAQTEKRIVMVDMTGCPSRDPDEV
jgi:hypothetical protein